MAAGTLSIYVHEFAHGLAALISGGYFLGIQGEIFNSASPCMAYADAWSDGHDILVSAAGIGTNVVIGCGLLWLAFRTRPTLPRLMLFMLSNAFLGDFLYGFEGCLGWRTEEFDMSVILREVNSLPVQWACTGFFFLGLCLSTCLVAHGLFRCWERILGPLSLGRSLWVILLLSNPAPIPNLRGHTPGSLYLISLILLIGVTRWLVRARMRGTGASLERISFRWFLTAWSGAVLAVIGISTLQQGIRFGSYPEPAVRDLHPGQQTVAGYSVLYGMGDRAGEDRPSRGALLFVSTPDRLRVVPSPEEEVLDVLWLPATDRVVAVCAAGILQAAPSSQAISWIWKPEKGKIVEAYHGRQGGILAKIAHGEDAAARNSLYLYDALQGFGKEFGETGAVGTPWFSPSLPVKTWVSVGEDIWEIEWTGQPVRVTRHEGVSKDRSIAGYSGEHRWVYDGTRWLCDETRVEYEGVEHWDIGSGGLTTIHEDGSWRRTTPLGAVAGQGRIEMDRVLLLKTVKETLWVALRSGDVRPLEEGGGAFKVLLPR